MIYLKLVKVWNQIENSWKGNPENFFLDKVKQEVAEGCPLYYFFSRNNQTSTTEYCSKLVILFVVPMGILLSFWRYLTHPAIWAMLDWASTLSEDSNDGNLSKYLTLHGWEGLTLVVLVTAWIARISLLTALTDLKFSFLNAKLFGDRETPELNNPETYPQSSWKKDHIFYISTSIIWKHDPFANQTSWVFLQYDHKLINKYMIYCDDHTHQLKTTSHTQKKNI